MDLEARLIDLASVHTRLLWTDIAAAAVAALGGTGASPPFLFALDLQNMPGFGSGPLRLAIDPSGVAESQVNRLRRTYESQRIIELAAIAIAGLGLYHGGGHEIRDVALRGSGADYLVDEMNNPLEVAGRSRRSDFAAAWDVRWQRLSGRVSGGFYVCVAEFETPAGRVAFSD